MQANGEERKVVFSTAVTMDLNPPASSDLRGKHRILAELKHLEQEARFLEEELEEVEKTVKVSAVVQELLRKIESNADPLLPITHGPVNPFWDSWFEGPPDSRHYYSVSQELVEWERIPRTKNLIGGPMRCSKKTYSTVHLGGEAGSPDEDAEGLSWNCLVVNDDLTICDFKLA